MPIASYYPIGPAIDGAFEHPIIRLVSTSAYYVVRLDHLRQVTNLRRHALGFFCGQLEWLVFSRQDFF